MNDPAYARLLRKRLARRHLIALAGSAGAGALLAACGSKSSSSSGAAAGDSGDASVTRPSGWSDETHGKSAEPNYAVVFPADKVNQVAVTVSAANWQKMLDDMTGLFGARGTGGVQGGGVPGDRGGALPGGGAAPGGGAGQGGPGAGGGDFTSVNPVWVPATVAFNGKTWTNVGLRFKGNSSLSSGWRSGSDKLPLKFDFDEFEADYPEIADQRFYGFKQFSLSNNFGDATFMRETVAYGIFEEAGLVAARTAPWEIILDRGEGPKSLGLYTAIEVIDDTVVPRVFEEDNGNIYEGDGRAASFAAGTESQIEASFQAEGGDNPDWSDIKALYAAIHASNRTTDAAAWRKKLESLFEVDVFLEWLGIAATLQHWDTYGSMSHNYYLYNNPANGRLTWISWDHNEVFSARGGAGGNLPAGGAGPIGRNVVTFDKKEVGTGWPLIRYLLDQPEYLARYNRLLKESVTLFDETKLSSKYQQLAAIRKPHIAADSTESAFTAAVQALTQATQTRADALKAYVNSL